MKKKNGFTLIELLAVIIILGILMIIAIPSVTKYISDSRKNAYIDTAKEIISGARNIVNEGKLAMYDTNAAYYIPSSCVKTENASKSPYGEFIKDKTYVIVTYDGKGYKYYWISLDDVGEGIKTPIEFDSLDISNIESDIKFDDIVLQAVDGKKKIVVFNDNCTGSNEQSVSPSGKIIPVNNCTFDGAMVQGAEYVNGQYTYRYKQHYKVIWSTEEDGNWENIEDDGWGVILTDKNTTVPTTTRICTSINNKPIISMQGMFKNSNTTSIDISSFDTSNVKEFTGMFYNCKNLSHPLDLSNFDTSKGIDFQAMVLCYTQQSIILDNWDFASLGSSSGALGGFFTSSTSLKTISARNWKNVPPSFTHGFFRGLSGGSSIETIDVTGWDLHRTTDITGIFASGGGLKNIIGLDTWDTSNITNMNSVFQSCNKLTSIDLSSWNLTNVTDVTNFVHGCTSISTAYVKTQNDANKLNNSSNKPDNITFVVK